MPDEYDPNAVEQPVPDYYFYMELLELPHALMKGTPGMREKGQKFLPKERKEHKDDYKVRLERTFLLNAYEDTVEKLTGQVFSEPVELPDDMADEIKVWSEDIDLSGHNITTFAKEVFKSGVVDGVTHILVDLPQIETRRNPETDTVEFFDEPEDEDGEGVWKPLTREAMLEKDWRPYFIHVKSNQLIGWRFEKVKGSNVLTQIRIMEETEEPDGAYGVKTVHRIRVLEPGRWEVWIKVIDEDDKETWELESQGVRGFDFIPLITYIIGQPISQMTAEPPLDDLAYLNLAHWQSDSDQNNILHYARLITYFGKRLGIEQDSGKKVRSEAVIGANVLIHTEDEQGDLKVVEHSGAAIEAGRNRGHDLEAQMRAYGMSVVLGNRTGDITATETAINTSETDSKLRTWALLFAGSLNEAIKMGGRMMSMEDDQITGSEEVKVNTDFRSFLRTMEVRELREAAMDGIIPKQLLVEEYKRRGIIKTDADFDELMLMIHNEQRNEREGFERSNNDIIEE